MGIAQSAKGLKVPKLGGEEADKGPETWIPGG